MAFSASEIWRIKAELGFNVLSNGAEPYISIVALFDQVINTNIAATVETTSATSVTAATTATPVTLVLTSASGFAAGNRVGIDVDDRFEMATIASLSGTSATVLLTKAHSGTYPVVLDGPILMARQALAEISRAKAELASSYGYGALKKVDEVEFYNHGTSHFGAIGEQVAHWRDELASMLGAPNMWRRKRSAGSAIALY